MRNSIGRSLVVAVILIVVWAGGAVADSTPDWVKQGKRGGSLNLFHDSNPELWDPHRAATRHSAQATRSLYNGLVMYSPVPPTDTIIGDLAKSWEVSADGTTYTFHLHEKAKWWDGKPVTADDVVFSLNRMVEPGQPRPRTGALKPYYESSRAIDAHTVEVKTKFPSAAFLSFLAADYMVIVPKHVLEAGIDINVPGSIIGSGPFKQAGFRRGAFYAFERNPDYWKAGLPFLDSVKVHVITDKGRALTALLTGQVLGHIPASGSGITVRQAAALERDSRGRVKIQRIFSGPGGIFVNFKRKPFDDPRVRKAISLALDRRELNQAIYQGKAGPGTVFRPGSVTSLEDASQWPGHRYTPDGKKDPRDIAEAKRLLAEAGYPNGFETEYMYRNIWTYGDEAPFVKAQLAKVGIVLNLKVVESAAGLAAYAAGEYDIGRIDHGITITDPDEIFTSIYLAGGSRNQVGYEDPKIRKIFERQARESDQEKRQMLLKEAANLLKDGEGHWFTIWWFPQHTPTNIKVKNVHGGPTIHVLNTLEHLWLDPNAKP
jgi:peptide/nickel transport system substrate-binding protein